MMHWTRRIKKTLLAGSTFLVGAFGGEKTAPTRRSMAFEPLEPRLPLSAAGLVEVGTQPDGGLSDKIVYIHPGHGYENQDGSWHFQRSEVAGTEMIEDLGNYDQMTFLADYLFRAGATIVPLRPVGHQPNEVVLDNDDAGVTFVGVWSDSESPVFYGSAGDLPYRYASTSTTETAYARYRPNLSEEGFYPVYAWTRSGSDRASDQLYRVHHTGGITEVTVNHRRVGNGLVYLGTYYFDAGTDGYVDISNKSSESGRVVIADMIRFGNGIGDSGLPREDEASLYWIRRHAAPPYAQGISASTYGTSVVSAAPKFATFMNRESDGSLSDRVFISYHSNASGGRGVLGLYNGNNNPATATPNQFLLANTLASEVNTDMVAQNHLWDPDWFHRSTVTLDRGDIEFGEINNNYIQNEFDATIVEVAFHDNIPDSQLMRDANVRDAVARATYQGLLKYFRAVEGSGRPPLELPPPVTHVEVVSNAPGSVTLSWQPPSPNSYSGGTPTGYRIYASVNGYGFDGGTFVPGGTTTTVTLDGYDADTPYYFKVVAVNPAGESHGSEVLTVLPSGGAKQVLIVNGFDRLDRAMNHRQSLPAPYDVVDRVRPRQSNARDYTVQVGEAIHAAAPGVHFGSTSNEAVISGAVDLTDYDSVIWILGEESTADDTFDATEQTKVQQFIAGGGNLFVTGAEIGWDLDAQGNGVAFFENTLKGNYVSDDANTYNVAGAAGSIFAGLNFAFDNGTLFYDAEWPDVINPQAGAQTAVTYVGGTGGSAGIQAAGTGGRGNVVMFGFPFETITTAANRTAVIERVLDFFGVSAIAPPNADFNGDGTVDAADYIVWRRTNGNSVPPQTAGDADGDGMVNDADYAVWREQFGTSPGAGSAAAVVSAAIGGADAGEDELQLDPSQFTSALIAQPAGALTGKIVYTSAGHGWQWNSNLGRYATDRPDYNEIVEDFGNQDQMTFFADYLLRAGATVVPMRPVGHQTNEVVLDNDSPGVTYSGTWQDSASSIHYDEDYGAVSDPVGYRFSSTTATETAVATYTPNIPEAGFYPVYTWVLDSGNRTNQLYRINAGGGVTEIRVDHRRVGKGWVYLGTYYFDQGTGGNVQISNQSTEGGVAIADAIRFGNGMGDYRDGPVTSGYPREDENSLMWLNRAIGQGQSASSIIGTGNVSAPSRMAEHMNAAPFGDAVYIGFHSNGTTGNPATATARGAVGLITSSNPTPNQAALALYTGRQINQDMQALNGHFEHNWSNRTAHTFTSVFGEIDEGASAEMDMTIIEVGFHDNTQDAQLMRDPKVREQLARSTYEAVLEYFDNFGGLNNPASQPSAPTNVRVISNANGDITVSWTAGPTGVQGGPPTGFRVYVSRNGYGFYEYHQVVGAGANSFTIPAAELDDDAYYFKVVAFNSGGESPRSAVAGARKNGDGGTNPILVVDGFDRYDRTQNVRYPYAFTSDGLVDRVWARSNNSFDYIAQVGPAIEAYEPAPGIRRGFDFVQNEAVINGEVDLSNYSVVVWLSGEESTVDHTFDATEQAKVQQFIAGGGHFFASGSEIGWDLDQQNHGRTFYENTLKANYVADDANTYNVTPAAGGIFAGIANFSFDDGSQFYDADYPDVISPRPGAQMALSYQGGTGGGAAIQAVGTGGSGNVVVFGFPFETITTASSRAAVLDRVFDFFGLDVQPENADFNADGTVDAADYIVWRRTNGTSVPAGTAGDANHDGNVDQTDYNIWRSQFGTSPGAGSGAAALSEAFGTGSSVEPANTVEPESTMVVATVPAHASVVPAAENTRGNRAQSKPLASNSITAIDEDLALLLARSQPRDDEPSAPADGSARLRREAPDEPGGEELTESLVSVFKADPWHLLSP